MRQRQGPCKGRPSSHCCSCISFLFTDFVVWPQASHSRPSPIAHGPSGSAFSPRSPELASRPFSSVLAHPPRRPSGLAWLLAGPPQGGASSRSDLLAAQLLTSAQTHQPFLVLRRRLLLMALEALGTLENIANRPPSIDPDPPAGGTRRRPFVYRCLEACLACSSSGRRAACPLFSPARPSMYVQGLIRT